MTIADDTDIRDRLEAYRAYLTNADARAALDLLVNAADADPRYIFDPVSHGNIERTVNYVVATRNPYAFIVNKRDLLFYFRKPSGLASAEKLKVLQAAGLNATSNNSGEIRVRIATEDDARKTLAHLSFEVPDGSGSLDRSGDTFSVGKLYTREDVIRLAGDDATAGGAWFTGYRSFRGAFFIFCGVGAPGRTGHDYGNRFDGEDLLWKGKTDSRKGQPLIDAMVAPDALVHIFWRIKDRDPFTYAGRATAVEVDDASPVGVRWRFQAQRASERLPAETLRKATPEYVFAAVQGLLAGNANHPFGSSTDYDLIADDGSRLPPKAVFGIALSEALGGAPIGPKHFTAGDTSTCFRLLREAGYQIVPKGEPAGPPVGDVDTDEDAEWSEGKQRLVSHLRRERGPGLAAAKKAQFRRQHGKLLCERCGLDPVAHYGLPEAEACIEVHHADLQVAEMSAGHKTKLADLKCLCANCHRLIHRALRSGLKLET